MDVGDGVFGCGTHLLDARRSDQPVKALVLGGDLERQSVDLVGVAHIAFCEGLKRLVSLIRIWGLGCVPEYQMFSFIFLV